jgi:hypothetical protein
MTWTDPSTAPWLAGHEPTSAELIAHVTNNLKMLGDAWGSYSPTWSASGTAPAIGNGTLNGFYMQVGKWVRARIFLDYGTTTTAGTGTWQFTLPVASVVGRGSLGTAVCYDGGVLYPRLAYQNGTSTLVLSDFTPTRVGATNPFSWNSSSELNIMMQYEAA